jgi:tetratricopeptide (TPR) repeat protein
VALYANDVPVEALKLGRSNLAAHRRAYGDEHPATLCAMGALAQSLSDLQDHAAALALQMEVVAAGRRVAGVGTWHRGLELEPKFYETREVPHQLCSLARTHDSLGNHQLALPLYQEAVEILSKVLDADAQDLLIARNNLANCHSQMGDHQLALTIYMDVLKRERRVLGNAHPHTLTNVGNCAETLCQLGDHAAAAPLFQEAVAGMTAVRGGEYFDTRYLRRWMECNTKGECGPEYDAFKAEHETMYERRAKRPRTGHGEPKA